MHSFHFEKKIRFKVKAFKEISFLPETTSIHSLSGAIQNGRRSRNMTCFRLHFHFGLYYDALSSLNTYQWFYAHQTRRKAGQQPSLNDTRAEEIENLHLSTTICTLPFSASQKSFNKL